ncbi:MAG: stage V sporulation protein AD [Clostridia bacterium]|nr:stage V sporulation protein AD [Clostridia bacterium]
MSFTVSERSTLFFHKPPSVATFASVVGKKEGEGPYGKSFDRVESDAYFGQKTWESAESTMFKEAVTTAIEKGSFRTSDISFLASGDLLNQCTATGYAARRLNIPFLGLYGACSTMAESLFIAALLVSGGAKRALAATSSHFCSSERQFRFPLEYGSQRPPTSQWTVTGAGAVILESEGKGPYITCATAGKVIDAGVCDANNMGCAMAPAFCDTVVRHLSASKSKPTDYDLIISGDLGYTGKRVASDLLKQEYHINIDAVYSDCGCMIFDPKKQDVHSGGSGCGCSASMLAGYILPQMKKGHLNRVLFVATGALMSPTMSCQGESIPSIAHAIEFNNCV